MDRFEHELTILYNEYPLCGTVRREGIFICAKVQNVRNLFKIVKGNVMTECRTESGLC